MACEAEESAFNAKLAEATQDEIEAQDAESEAQTKRNAANASSNEAQVLYALWQECLANQ